MLILELFWGRRCSTPLMYMIGYIIGWKFPLTNTTHELAVFVCWEESTMHNRMNKALSCCQGDVASIVVMC